MPYEIKEKKGKKFSVVNKETGKVMSKDTTMPKAKKQIKAIYANMPPEHRLRHRVGLLDGVGLMNPVHKSVVKLAKRLLKKEEVYGNGFFDSKKYRKGGAYNPDGKTPIQRAKEKFIKDHPVLTLVLNGTTYTDVIKAVEENGPTAVEIAIPESAPLIEMWKLSQNHHNPYSPDNLTEEEQFAHLHEYGEDDYYDEDEYEEDEDLGTMNESEKDAIDFKNIKTDQEINKMVFPKKSTDNLTPVERLDKLVEHIIDEHHHLGLDDALRFPMIYNYDENNKPMYLQEWLVSNGTAGRNFSVEEFGNTYKNQRPFAFLNFPINGGRLGKIDYSTLGYSKY